MTREERNELLADLRAAGVKRASFYQDGTPMAVGFFPAAAPAKPAADEDRPLPKAKRSLDERLFDPLGIGEKPEAQG